MISYLDIQNASGSAVRFHATASRKLTNAEGLPGVLGFQGARDATYSRPSYHGNVTRSRWQQAGLVSLEGFIYASSPDAALAEYDTLAAPLYDALDTPRLMLWQRGTDGTGVQLQAYVRLTGDEVSVAQEAAGKLLRYQAHLRLDDPRGYSQTLTTATGGTVASSGGGFTFARTLPATFNPGTGGTVAVNNTGTRPTPPILRVYGYLVNPRILLIGTTKQIALVGVVGAGDYLEIDVANRTVKLNGVSPAQGYVDASTTSWFELPRGASTLQLLAGANDTISRADVLYRAAYL